MKREEPVDVHKGKKIVDYWEDGLAIYEDGTKQEKQAAAEEVPLTNTDGMWEEGFSSHHDSKPFGPVSVGS